MGLGAWLLWQLRDRFRAGVLFAIYLLYAGAERFLVEFVRRNERRRAGAYHRSAGECCDDGGRRRLDIRGQAPARDAVSSRWLDRCKSPAGGLKRCRADVG